jgi:alkyl sulfatase BDS1-like metallo-beta-lactamase superfamily hydrolase
MAGSEPHFLAERARNSERFAPKAAEPAVKAKNASLLDALPFDDGQDFEDAERGFIDPP